MLSKAEMKACLAGESTPTVPAYLFWFDGKFAEKNAAEVDHIRKRYRGEQDASYRSQDVCCWNQRYRTV